MLSEPNLLLPRIIPRRVVEVPPGHAARGEVEGFIRRVYADRFGADVRAFMPHLVALQDADGRVLAAAGWRDADAGSLFLERYLDAPVEALLGLRRRAGIAEVGHLASQQAGEGRRLILQLGPHLAAHGARWVVGTLTEELRHLFGRLGIAPIALGLADPAALGDEAAAWGRYYDHRPLVLAGSLEAALAVLRRRGVVA